jgi:chlorite dismutase
VGGSSGPWRIDRVTAVVGATLPASAYLEVLEGSEAKQPASGHAFCLRGTTGHVRYVEAAEKGRLAAVTPALGRAEATCAALIPIRKSDAWWELAQDERRAILEARSRHLTIGLHYLPAIARRLYHARELGEPFDFLTWFEYAPEHAGLFDELVGTLRSTEEWAYVEREVDLRLTRFPA